MHQLCRHLCVFGARQLALDIANNCSHRTAPPSSSGATSSPTCLHPRFGDGTSCLYLVDDWGGNGSHFHLVVAGKYLPRHQFVGNYSCAKHGSHTQSLIGEVAVNLRCIVPTIEHLA